MRAGNLLATLAAAIGACLPLSATPALADHAYGPNVTVQVEVLQRYREAPRWHRHRAIPAPGPALYYGVHPHHLPGYPVPLFPTSRPAMAYPLAVRYEAPAHHVGWCQAHYRSYRVRDNSFQPFQGPRRQCRSPFG